MVRTYIWSVNKTCANAERSQVHLLMDRSLHREIKSAAVLSEFGTITRLTEFLWRRWLARRRKAA